MKTLKSSLVLILWLCLIVPVTKGQTKFDTLTTRLKQIFDKDSLPGMSVILVDQKHIIYEQNYGYANIAGKIRYTSKSIQNIGSVSKTFTAIALMKAIESGYFNLKTDINDILPFKVYNPNFKGAVITVQELSNHTSGILDNTEILPNTYHFKEDVATYDSTAYHLLKDLGYKQKVGELPLGTFLREYLADGGKYYQPNNFGVDEPGKASHYSNIASALAAYLIEVKSGMSYAQFTEKYILKPLKMHDSGWFFDAKKLNKYARPYFNSSASFPFYQFITYPDGGLRTNTNDLSKYLIALINGYKGNQLLISKSSYQTMFTPQFSKDNPPKGISLAYRNKGIFWNLYNSGIIGHDGDDPGVSTFLFFNPKTGLGGVFLCNKYLNDKSEIINALTAATK